MPLDLRVEVAEAGPVQAAVEIDFGDDDVAPLYGFGQPLAGVPEAR